MQNADHLMPNYNRLPLSFARGEGVWLYDDKGTKYLDTVAGIAVCALGHAHPAVTDAVCSQVRRIVHSSNLYRIENQQRLSRRLAEISGLEAAFFCNSGAEVNEAAIKLARLYAHNEHHYKAPLIAVMKNAFHGRTMGAWSATRPSDDDSPFAPLLPGFVQADFGDVDQLRDLVSQHPQLCAVMLEPIQGEAGVHVPAAGYLRAVRKLCDDHRLLMIVDEVQTGIARTGRWYCFAHDGVVPDIVCSAKALANGVPIGACIATGEVAKHLVAGTHGSTFGGNPLACAAALAVLDTIEQEGLIEHAAGVGDYLMAHLHSALPSHLVREVRGRGLMIGVELTTPCGELPLLALEENLLINVAGGNTIRLLPPLILAKSEADIIIGRLTKVLTRFEGR